MDREINNVWKVASSHRGKCFICLKSYNKLYLVKKESILRAFKDFKIIINPKSMHCSKHLDRFGIIKVDQHDYIPWRIQRMNIKAHLTNRDELNSKCDVFEPFNNVDTITEKYCHQITGWTKTQFSRFCKYITSINNTENRSKEELVAIYRYWLRKGLDQTSLALLKTQSSQQQISFFLSTIRTAINKDFVNYFLGARQDRDFYLKHNNVSTIELHQLKADELAIFADATYCRIEKSADNRFQYNTWSQQKLDLLIKPFIICCSDGYIIDIYGPYNANKNDSTIFDHILETDDNLRKILLAKKTICFLDRGFRDIHTELVSKYDYRVEIPHCKQKDDQKDDQKERVNKKKQLSTFDANRTRNVTKLRFIVELVNGQLKNYKALDNIRNTQLGHIAIDYRIAAAMLNFTHNSISPDKEKSKEIAGRMRRKSQLKHNKLEFILGKTLGTHTIRQIFLKDIVDFPRLKKSVIKNRISLGTFQLRLSQSYIKDIIDNNFTFIVNNEILKEIKNKKLRTDLARSKYKILAMEILSRHSRSRKSAKDDLKKNDLKKLNQLYTKVYKVFILYKPNVNNYTGINAYICSCMSGQRTNGCCVHVTSVIYFLSYLNHKNQSMLKFPGNHLNNILVDINSSRAANNPQYLRNQRRIKDLPSSSESDNDIFTDSEADLSEFEEKKLPQIYTDDKDKGKKKLSKKSESKKEGKQIKEVRKQTKKPTRDLMSEQDKGKKKLSKKSESKKEDKQIKEVRKETKKPTRDLMSEKELRNNAWLTDNEIWGFLTKMRDYFDSINIEFNGLYDPILITNLRFGQNETMRQKSFVQILHSGNNHWVTVSAGLPFDGHDLSLFDSLSRRSIDPQLGTLTSLICERSMLAKGYLTYRVKNVQVQKGDFCGYFALANAMALCIGLNPEDLVFTETDLRDHFIRIMYHDAAISMFPYMEKPRLRQKANKYLRFELKKVQLIEQ